MKLKINTKAKKITYVESCCAKMANIICTEQINVAYGEDPSTSKVWIPGTTISLPPLSPGAPSVPDINHSSGVTAHSMQFCPKCGKAIVITEEK